MKRSMGESRGRLPGLALALTAAFVGHVVRLIRQAYRICVVEPRPQGAGPAPSPTPVPSKAAREIVRTEIASGLEELDERASIEDVEESMEAGRLGTAQEDRPLDGLLEVSKDDLSPATPSEVAVTANDGVDQAMHEPAKGGSVSPEASASEISETPSRIAPISRGGRPRVAESSKGGVEAGPERKTRLRPELICWKADRSWHVGVEVPAELLADSTVIHNGDPLVSGTAEPSVFELREFGGQVVVQRTAVPPLSMVVSDAALVFRLGSAEANHGRHVRIISPGSYLVVAPAHLERDESHGGLAFFEPEPAAVPGYRAHYFDVNEQQNIAFESTAAYNLVKRSTVPVELVGQPVEDAALRMGPLYGSVLPVLQVPRSADWDAIAEIVVGEEGSGAGRWRMSFEPAPAGRDVELPRALLNRQVGWFYARVYDRAGDLLTSFDFRLAVGLHAVVVEQVPVLPDEDGHNALRIDVTADPSLTVEWKGMVPTGRRVGSQSVHVPAEPDFDELNGELSGSGATVPIQVVIPRIWWHRCDEGAEPTDWSSIPLSIKASDIDFTSREAICLRLPSAHWFRSLSWAFSWVAQRGVEATGRCIFLPLRDVLDAIPRTAGDHELMIRAEDRDGRYHSGVIAVFRRVARCCLCKSEFEDDSMAAEHLESHDCRERFEELGLNELRERFPDLPLQVYRCEHCGRPAPSRSQNLLDDVIHHIERDCKTPRPPGPRQVSFSIIKDPAVIRDELIHDLERILVCKSCEMEFDDPSEAEMRKHTTRAHRRELTEIV